MRRIRELQRVKIVCHSEDAKRPWESVSQERTHFSQNSVKAEHFVERIATPFCAMAWDLSRMIFFQCPLHIIQSAFPKVTGYLSILFGEELAEEIDG